MRPMAYVVQPFPCTPPESPEHDPTTRTPILHPETFYPFTNG